MQNSASIAFRSFKQARKPLQFAGRKRTWQRSFHTSHRLDVVKPFILADIGEGITEVQIIQWFVQPGARVEQFDKLCEVQSDKASVEITSRFDGVIKKLHYEQDDTAKVGKALCDIDIEGEVSPDDEALLSPEGEQAGTSDDAQQPQKAAEKQQPEPEKPRQTAFKASPPSETRQSHNGHVSSLATPAVRGLLKELGVRIEDVRGTGRDGRVLKEDVHDFVASREAPQQHQQAQSTETPMPAAPKPRSAIDDGPQQENTVTLTPIQAQMFKVMTRSLSIPHLMYADEIDISSLSTLRQTLNSHPASPGKLSLLPFVVKAVSLALNDFPLLNSRVDAGSSEDGNGNGKPKIVMRSRHNIGVAMDTPQGLLVPNIKNVGALSIRDIAEQLAWLQQQARAGKLTTTDLTGGTITVSNIGSIGGTYVSPVIVQSEVAILGMGRARVIPAFETVKDGATGKFEGKERIVKKTIANFSWSADHRVVDGATMARMAERVRMLVEDPGLMMAEMR